MDILNNLINISEYKEIISQYDFLDYAIITIAYLSGDGKYVWTEGFKNKSYPSDEKSFIFHLKRTINNTTILTVGEYIDTIEKFNLIEKYNHSITISSDNGNVKMNINNNNLNEIKNEYCNLDIIEFEWSADIGYYLHKSLNCMEKYFEGDIKTSGNEIYFLFKKNIIRHIDVFDKILDDNNRKDELFQDVIVTINHDSDICLGDVSLKTDFIQIQFKYRYVKNGITTFYIVDNKRHYEIYKQLDCQPKELVDVKNYNAIDEKIFDKILKMIIEECKEKNLIITE